MIVCDFTPRLMSFSRLLMIGIFLVSGHAIADVKNSRSKIADKGRDIYVLETLQNGRSGHAYDKKLGSFLALQDDVRPSLEKCLLDHSSRGGSQNIFFKSIALPLAQKKKIYLVVPKAPPCPDFIAAHLVYYWIVEIGPSNIKLLHDGQCDELRILRKITNGFRDFVCYRSYESPGDPPLIHRYDGSKYK